MKAKSFIVDLKPYPFDLLISINQSEAKFKADLDYFGIEFDDPEFHDSTCNARTSFLPTGQTIVRFKDLRKNPRWYGIIAHEAFHVVEFLFFKIGMPHSVEYTSEAYAYLLQHIVSTIHHKL